MPGRTRTDPIVQIRGGEPPQATGGLGAAALDRAATPASGARAPADNLPTWQLRWRFHTHTHTPTRARQSRAQCRARELSSKILSALLLHKEILSLFKFFIVTVCMCFLKTT